MSLGRRDAVSKLAHFLCELVIRLRIAGCAETDSTDFPLTQDEIAECLGLTPVHVNRTLQEIRRRELIRLENKRLTILDLPGLMRLAEFDPMYLYLRQERH